MERPAPTSPFLELPPELSNFIYDYVFSRDIPTGTIELRSAMPPRKALALVNRQLYEECRILYREAYRKYWITSAFKVTKSVRNPGQEFYNYLPIAGSRTMDQLTNLTIHFDLWCVRTQSFDPNQVQLIDPRGIWRLEYKNVRGRVNWVYYDVLKPKEGLQLCDRAMFDTIEDARAECENIEKPLRLARQIQSMMGYIEDLERWYG